VAQGKRDSEDSDGGAWQALDRFDLEFASDPRSVHLGLSTNGFHPHSTDSSMYSCWPVFIMPYNLPPNKCLKQEFIFLALVISGPMELKKQMDIFLHPLMKVLNNYGKG
jgi:hypothetical protein